MLECNEPMHLCVSSKYLDVFKLACTLVEELLQTIYKEYAMFCQKIGKNLVVLSVKKLENHAEEENEGDGINKENSSETHVYGKDE